MHICILPFINFNKHYLVHLYDWSDRFVCPARAPCGLHCHFRGGATGLSAEDHIRIRQNSNNSGYSTVTANNTNHSYLEEPFTPHTLG